MKLTDQQRVAIWVDMVKTVLTSRAPLPAEPLPLAQHCITTADMVVQALEERAAEPRR